MKLDVNELAKWFQLEYPEHTKAMKEVTHHYDETHLNGYHLEGDVFTHTMMVLNAAKLMRYNDVIQMSALLHDLGKPYVAERDDEKQKIYFKNHEGVSFWLAIDIVKKLTQDPKKRETVLKLISLHSVIFDNHKDGRFTKDFISKFRKDQHFLELIKQQVISDSMGRFCLDLEDVQDTFDEIFDEDFYAKLSEEANKPEVFRRDNTITLLIGLPRSGKSTWIKNNLKDEVLICRDDEVMKLAQEKYHASNYSDAFRVLSEDDQKRVDDIIEKKYHEANKAGKNIIVDMTNMTKKSRRRWTGNFLGRRKAIVFATDYNEILRRNEMDKINIGKYIPEKVIFSMAKKFTYPQYDEFDEIDLLIWD